MNHTHAILRCCVCSQEFDRQELQGCINVTHISMGIVIGMHVHFHFPCAFNVLFGNFLSENPSVAHKIEITRVLLEKLNEVNELEFNKVN